MPDAPQPTFFQQETPYSCVPACLKMVLSAFGIEATEDDLRQRSLTTLWGTRASDVVACIKSFGLEAEAMRDATQANIREWLQQGLFPILLIDLRPIHNEVGRHAVVAEEIVGRQLIYLDPLIGRRTVELDLFEQAWQLNYHRAILISRSLQRQ